MTKVNPQLRMKVANLLENDGSEMSASLDFKTMEDFEPHRIVEQLEPLKKLMDTRNKLRDLLTKADRSEDLEAILEDVLSNTNALSSLSNELGVDNGGKKED
jgi:type VI secretion system protein ImpB